VARNRKPLSPHAAGIVRRDGTYISRPEGLDFPTIDVHVNGDIRVKEPQLFYRLRVVADYTRPGGVLKLTRNVYLESSRCPFLFRGTEAAPWQVLLSGENLSPERVADFIRWADRMPGVVIVYEPGGNMAGYLRPKANGQTKLFE
jgi:hypothetical protein